MQHSFDGLIEHKHHHVIEIEMIIRSDDSDFVEFKQLEEIVYGTLKPYQNQYLNEFDEFKGNTTIENIGEVLFKKFDIVLNKEKLIICRFEISETPLRVYAIVAEEI